MSEGARERRVSEGAREATRLDVKTSHSMTTKTRNHNLPGPQSATARSVPLSCLRNNRDALSVAPDMAIRTNERSSSAPSRSVSLTPRVLSLSLSIAETTDDHGDY